MLILGLNMFHADASAAIVQDGEVVFAIAEERLNRKKHYGGFPTLAIQACLDAVGAKISDVQHVAVGQDSDANLSKKVQYALANPDKLLNFIRMRQRKEGIRDVRCASIVGNNGPGVPYQADAPASDAITHVYDTRCLPGDQGHDPYVLASCGQDGYSVEAVVVWRISYSAAGPVAGSGALPARTTETSAPYPVSESRAFMVSGGGH